MTKYLTQDIYSYNRSIYGYQNEEVTVISDCLHVAIVEGKNGRFPVLVEKLSDEMVLVVLDVTSEPVSDQLKLF